MHQSKSTSRDINLSGYPEMASMASFPSNSVMLIEFVSLLIVVGVLSFIG